MANLEMTKPQAAKVAKLEKDLVALAPNRLVGNNFKADTVVVPSSNSKHVVMTITVSATDSKEENSSETRQILVGVRGGTQLLNPSEVEHLPYGYHATVTFPVEDLDI